MFRSAGSTDTTIGGSGPPFVIFEPAIVAQRRDEQNNCRQIQLAHAVARPSRYAFSRALRVMAAARSNCTLASASRPALNRKSPLAAGNGA